MNDERFFDLAMRVIARQAGDAERAELDALLAREPELRTEFARLQADARVAKDALPLANAMEATVGEFPAYARERLQTKVRQTFGRPAAAAKEPDRSFAWGLRWVLGLAAATAVVMLVVLPMFRAPTAPTIQLAMLESGGTRGSVSDEVALLKQTWQTTVVHSFSDTEALRAWETSPADAQRQPTVKIIYDATAGEVRVLGRWKEKPLDKTFLVERDFATTLKLVKDYVAEQTKR
jgi:anti-sigma factor RsiW